VQLSERKAAAWTRLVSCKLLADWDGARAAAAAYKALTKATKTQCALDKRNYIHSQAQQIASLMLSNRTHQAYQRLNSFTGRRHSVPPTALRLPESGKIVTGQAAADGYAAHFVRVLTNPVEISADLMEQLPSTPSPPLPPNLIAAAAIAYTAPP
jgi:hypothetical protein